MTTHCQCSPLPWPPLPDEAVVELHSMLNDFMLRFESHYLAQIERPYCEQSRDNLAQPYFVQPDLFRSINPDEPPF